MVMLFDNWLWLSLRLFMMVIGNNRFSLRLFNNWLSFVLFWLLFNQLSFRLLFRLFMVMLCNWFILGFLMDRLLMLNFNCWLLNWFDIFVCGYIKDIFD